tara:strand:+ start:4916 stop:5164 length:249 start_codon:yes stop_codon:yes gene_type:complete
MTCCKECLDLLCDYLEGELDDKTSRSLEQHFEDCPPCIAFFKTYKTTAKLCRESFGTIEIPPEVKKKLTQFIKDNIQPKLPN